MPHIERTIDIVWEGNVARGNGTITGRSGAFTDLPFSLPSRIAVTQGKTSPEELLAAAHAGCLTMSIAGELTKDGTPPERLDVTCTIVMDEVEGQGHEIVASHVTISGGESRTSSSSAPTRVPVLAPAQEGRRRGHDHSCLIRSLCSPRSGGAQADGRRRVGQASGKRDRPHAVGLVDDVEAERGGEPEGLLDRLHRSGGDTSSGERGRPLGP